MNGFKVTLYLNQIFNDHRSVCRIFVNFDEMKTIKDLQDHIATMFDIRNFYLMAQNQFLPSMESIHVLSVDDMIFAIPLKTTINSKVTLNSNCNSSKKSDASKDSSSENAEEQVRRKRKKKFKDDKDFTNKKVKHLYTANCAVNVNDTNENKDPSKHTSTPYDTINVEKDDDEGSKNNQREMKFRKRNLINKIAEVFDENTEEVKSNPKNSVKTKVKYFEKQIDQHPSVSSIENTQKPQLVELTSSLDKEEPELDNLDISDLMRRHRLYVKPNDGSKKISTELPKQHNIVKSIIVSMGSSEDCITSGFNSGETSKSQSESLQNRAVQDSRDLASENKINILQDVILTPKKIIEKSVESIDHNMTETSTSLSKHTEPLIPDKIIVLQQDEQFVTPESITCNDPIELQSQQEQFVTKRKRKRVRKRKLEKEKIEPAVVPKFDLKMKISKASPAIHIKFDEDSNDEKCETVGSTKEKPQEFNQEIVNIDSEQNDNEKPDIEVVSLENQPECSMVGKDCPKGINNGAFVNIENVPLDVINSYPPMMDIMPQPGNTIAFKILTLGFSFTPELSAYITGKVLDVSSDEKAITVDITGGLEEANKGIESFSLDYEEDLTCGLETTKKYEWRHLVDTRLLSS